MQVSGRQYVSSAGFSTPTSLASAVQASIDPFPSVKTFGAPIVAALPLLAGIGIFPGEPSPSRMLDMGIQVFCAAGAK